MLRVRLRRHRRRLLLRVRLRHHRRRLLLRVRLRRLRRQRGRARFQTVNLVLRRDDEMKRVRPPELQKRTNWERALTGCYRTIPRTRFQK
jgi:hypothetical protein